MAILDTDGLKNAVGGLQPFPAGRCRGDRNTAGHAEANVLPGLGLDLGQQVDGIGLKSRHIGIGIQGMHSAGGMPRGAGS